MKFVSVLPVGVFAAALLLAGPAAAKPGDCTVAEEARLDAAASTQRAAYLDHHPDVNNALSNALKTPGDGNAKHEAVQAYFDTNPSARADLDAIRQPVNDFKARCWPGETTP